MESHAEMSYSRYCTHYNKKNYIYNYPTWNELSVEDKTWWIAFVKCIKMNFKDVIEMSSAVEQLSKAK